MPSNEGHKFPTINTDRFLIKDLTRLNYRIQTLSFLWRYIRVLVY